jgi:hypothetical protein
MFHLVQSQSPADWEGVPSGGSWVAAPPGGGTSVLRPHPPACVASHDAPRIDERAATRGFG